MGRPPRDLALDLKILRLRAEDVSFKLIAAETGFSVGYIKTRAAVLRDDGALPRKGAAAKPAAREAAAPEKSAPTGIDSRKRPAPAPKAAKPPAATLKPGDLYRERLPCGALSPWVSIVPERRDGGRFDWRPLVAAPYSGASLPAALVAGVA